MYTFCPDCATIFTVSAEHVNAAGGRVRCGACANVFNADEYLCADLATVRKALVDYSVHKAGLSPDEKPAAPAAVTTAAVPDEKPVAPAAAKTAAVPDAQPAARATGRAARKKRRKKAGKAAAKPAAVQIEPAPVAQTAPEAQAQMDSNQPDADAEVPPLLSTTLSHPWARQSLTAADVARGAAIIVLLLLLGAQWLFFNRATLAGDADWRPVMERFCAVFHCQLPLRIDLARIELLNRDVRKHPLVEDALLVYATLNNSAEFAQPYPVFSIRFSDVTGKPVAMRHFMPVEYLDPEIDPASAMVPGVPVYVVLAIQDPGEDAVSFQFEFL